ncbi:MAG: MerC domain-containing protein [Pseudomonadota bacterium]|nr:MerC domain-containing protein [Pseudomonadota bacterium]
MRKNSSSNPAGTGARRRVDQLGIGLAGLCALHCVATVLIVSGLGIGGHFLLAPEIHRFGLAVAMVVAAVAIGWGVMRHRRATPFIVAVIGLIIMGAALLVEHGSLEAVLTIIGVTLVSIGHLLNIRSARLSD